MRAAQPEAGSPGERCVFHLLTIRFVSGWRRTRVAHVRSTIVRVQGRTGRSRIRREGHAPCGPGTREPEVEWQSGSGEAYMAASGCDGTAAERSARCPRADRNESVRVGQQTGPRLYRRLKGYLYLRPYCDGVFRPGRGISLPGQDGPFSTAWAGASQGGTTHPRRPFRSETPRRSG